jgi:hypothetical protein
MTGATSVLLTLAKRLKRKTFWRYGPERGRLANHPRSTWRRLVSPSLVQETGVALGFATERMVSSSRTRSRAIVAE